MFLGELMLNLFIWVLLVAKRNSILKFSESAVIAVKTLYNFQLSKNDKSVDNIDFKNPVRFLQKNTT